MLSEPQYLLMLITTSLKALYIGGIAPFSNKLFAVLTGADDTTSGLLAGGLLFSFKQH